MAQKSKIPKMTVHYYDESKTPDVVVVGQYEMQMADQKFGVGSIGKGNLGAVAFATFLGGQRAVGVIPAAVDFDTWNKSVSMIEPVEEESGESPAPPAI